MTNRYTWGHPELHDVMEAEGFRYHGPVRSDEIARRVTSMIGRKKIHADHDVRTLRYNGRNHLYTRDMSSQTVFF